MSVFSVCLFCVLVVFFESHYVQGFLKLDHITSHQFLLHLSIFTWFSEFYYSLSSRLPFLQPRSPPPPEGFHTVASLVVWKQLTHGTDMFRLVAFSEICPKHALMIMCGEMRMTCVKNNDVSVGKWCTGANIYNHTYHSEASCKAGWDHLGRRSHGWDLQPFSHVLSNKQWSLKMKTQHLSLIFNLMSHLSVNSKLDMVL